MSIVFFPSVALQSILSFNPVATIQSKLAFNRDKIMIDRLLRGFDFIGERVLHGRMTTFNSGQEVVHVSNVCPFE